MYSIADATLGYDIVARDDVAIAMVWKKDRLFNTSPSDVCSDVCKTSLLSSDVRNDIAVVVFVDGSLKDCCCIIDQPKDVASKEDNNTNTKNLSIIIVSSSYDKLMCSISSRCWK